MIRFARSVHRGTRVPTQARAATAEGDAAAVSVYHRSKEECLPGNTLSRQADACLAQFVILRMLSGVTLEGEKASCEAVAGCRLGAIAGRVILVQDEERAFRRERVRMPRLAFGRVLFF